MSGMSKDEHLRCAAPSELYEKLLVTEEGMSRTACDGRTVSARWLALIIIAQKSKGRGKERVKGGREGRMGWNLLAVSCAAGRGRSNGREAMNRGGKE